MWTAPNTTMMWSNPSGWFWMSTIHWRNIFQIICHPNVSWELLTEASFKGDPPVGPLLPCSSFAICHLLLLTPFLPLCRVEKPILIQPSGQPGRAGEVYQEGFLTWSRGAPSSSPAVSDPSWQPVAIASHTRLETIQKFIFVIFWHRHHFQLKIWRQKMRWLRHRFCDKTA